MLRKNDRKARHLWRAEEKSSQVISKASPHREQVICVSARVRRETRMMNGGSQEQVALR